MGKEMKAVLDKIHRKWFQKCSGLRFNEWSTFITSVSL